MLKYSLQFSFLFSVEYLVFMFLCFGLLGMSLFYTFGALLQ